MSSLNIDRNMLRRSVILIRGTVNRPGRRVSVEKGKLTRSGENFTLNNPTKRALIKQLENVTVNGG